MSEEQPKQSEAAQPASPTPTRPSPSGSSNSTVQQVTQTLQQGWQRVKPVLKTQSAKALRVTIRGLETAAEKLENSPEQSSSTTTSAQETSSSDPNRVGQPGGQVNFNELLEKAGPLFNRVQAGAATATEKLKPQLEKVKPQLEKLKPQLEKLQAWWTATLPKIRTRLPASINEKLSDRTLTSIAIASVALVFFWTTSAILPGKSRAPEVAKVPVSRRVPPADLTAPPQLSAPTSEAPVAIAPALEPAAPEVSDFSELEPTEIPAELTEPTAPETVAEVEPEPEAIAPPPPEPVLTPEQQLLVSIQEQVAETTKPYAEGLVQAIQANFPTSRLTVKVSNAWYDLPSNRQDKLANAMRDRAQDLDFSRLEITDATGTLLARSPIVGSEMVILKRQGSGMS